MVDIDDFVSGFFYFVEIMKEILEMGFGNNFIGCEDVYVIEGGVGVSFGG